MSLKKITASWQNFVGITYSMLGVAFLTSVADNYLGRRNILPVAPTVFAVLYLVPFVVALLVREFLSPRPGALSFTVFKKNIPVLLPMATLAVLSLLWSMHPSAYWGDKSKWIFIVPYGFLILLFSALLPCFPTVRTRFHWFSFLGLIALFCSILYDAYYPMTFSVEADRPAGFPGNSNWGALSLVLLAAVTLRYDLERARRFDLLVILITAMGVFLTLSRSGAANFLVLLILYVWLSVTKQGRSRKSLRALLSGAFTLIVLLGALPLIFMHAGAVNQSKGQYRLVAFLQGKLEDRGSSESRIAAGLDALRLIEQAPFLGHGTGHNRTMAMTPHDLYLKQWVDLGLPGLAAYLMLLGGAFWIFRKRSFAPGMALIGVATLAGFFTHNMLEQRSFLMTLGASATISLFEYESRQRKSRAEKQSRFRARLRRYRLAFLDRRSAETRSAQPNETRRVAAGRPTNLRVKPL